MPFQLCLYRAPEGLGPIDTWDTEHRQPLGTRDELQAALDQLLPGLRWKEGNSHLFASGPFNGEEHALEISLFGEPGDILLDMHIYAFPPPVRAVMSGLNLNYCYAEECGELYHPFDAGDRWPAAEAE